jgi:hypothetical protein
MVYRYGNDGAASTANGVSFADSGRACRRPAGQPSFGPKTTLTFAFYEDPYPFTAEGGRWASPLRLRLLPRDATASPGVSGPGEPAPTLDLS